jgi:hypothetical protein
MWWLTTGHASSWVAICPASLRTFRPRAHASQARSPSHCTRHQLLGPVLLRNLLLGWLGRPWLMQPLQAGQCGPWAWHPPPVAQALPHTLCRKLAASMSRALTANVTAGLCMYCWHYTPHSAVNAALHTCASKSLSCSTCMARGVAVYLHNQVRGQGLRQVDTFSPAEWCSPHQIMGHISTFSLSFYAVPTHSNTCLPRRH